MKKKWRMPIILLAVVVLLLAGYLVYTRPMTLTQLYPELDLDRCNLMEGYRLIPTGPGGIPFDQEDFRAEPGTESFDALWELLAEQKYRRSVLSLLPQGRRSHRMQAGEKLWEMTLFFDREDLPNGSFTGTMLHIRTTFGRLDLDSSSGSGSAYVCFKEDQKAWNKTVYDRIGA